MVGRFREFEQSDLNLREPEPCISFKHAQLTVLHRSFWSVHLTCRDSTPFMSVVDAPIDTLHQDTWLKLLGEKRFYTNLTFLNDSHPH